MKRKYSFRNRTKEHAAYADASYSYQYSEWSAQLRNEFNEYRSWRLEPFRLDRPRRLQQRPVSFDARLNCFECYFGYLVGVQGLPPDSLSLSLVGDPDLIHEYAAWHANEHRGYASRILQITTCLFLVVAEYYLRRPPADVEAIRQIVAAINPPTIRDMESKWVSLAELEQIGLAEWPDPPPKGEKLYWKKRRAVAAQRSMILRLLVRRPLRRRNICEMRLDHNLIQQGDDWQIYFRGYEMKVGRKRGKENKYSVSFPPDLLPELEAWLTMYRPLVNGNHPHVFTTFFGNPFSGDALNAEVRKCVYEYTGRAFNIHLVRHVWATEVISETGDFVLAAQMLGDKLETVIRRYTHLQNGEFGAKADSILSNLLNFPS